MLNFETFLIVMVCAVPFIALLMVLPKKIKKAKEKNKKPAAIKTLEEIKKEERIIEPKEIEPEKKEYIPKSEISTDEFKSYLQKRKPTSRPSRVELPKGFNDMTMPYIPRRRAKRDNKPKSLTEEIQNLSPELKALIIAGVLDPKNFDNT